jgi:hypothetical protein
MDSSDRTARIATAVAFVVAALVFWQTFEVYPAISKTELRDPVPAGEIVKGFEIKQTILPPADEGAAAPKGVMCIGLRFATYKRKNSGAFTVAWTQADRRGQWLVAASDLADNAFRYFCPDRGIGGNAPFTVSISGGNGRPGSAPTVWLTRDDSLGRVEGRSDGRALALRVTARKRIGARTIANIRHHAFLASWISTLFIGLVALLAAGARQKRTFEKHELTSNA